MKAHEPKNWIFVLVMLLIFAAIYLTMFATTSFGQNYGTSIEDRQAIVTFTHSLPMDSARATFGYPDIGNPYASVKLVPNDSLVPDSTVLQGDVSLDSLGTHTVRITYWETDAADTSGRSLGIWVHDWSAFIGRRLDGWAIGAFSQELAFPNADTLFLGYWTSPTAHTKTHFQVFYHDGGSAGGDPDSSRTFDIADR